MANRICTALAGLVLSLGASTAAMAQELEPWGAYEAWDILVDPGLGDGCLIQATYDNGAVVRVGFDMRDEQGYVAAFNRAWGEVVPGDTYDVRFDLDGELYDGTAEGIYLGEVPGAMIFFDNRDFLFDIAKKYVMTIYSSGDEVMAINLSGTYRALEGALECQAEMG